MIALLVFTGACWPDEAKLSDEPPERFPVIIDHDGAVDDFIALLIVESSGRGSIQGVTIAFGDSYREPAATATGKILSLFGIAVPVGLHPSGLRGPHRFPDEWRRANSRVAGLDSLRQIHEPPPPENAIQLLDNLLSNAESPVTILATGPLTNLAEVLGGKPRLIDQVERVVIMGGAVAVAGNASPPHAPLGDGSAEYNFFADPEAADTLLSLAATGLHITLVPLDLTNRLPVRSSFLDNLSEATSPRARLAREMLELVRDDMERGDYYLWDGAAAMVMLYPGMFVTERKALRVQRTGPSAGRVRADVAGGGLVDVAVRPKPGADPVAEALKLLSQ
jgi:inosine-uridine nucleoside N-ribohydrolase